MTFQRLQAPDIKFLTKTRRRADPRADKALVGPSSVIVFPGRAAPAAGAKGRQLVSCKPKRAGKT
jgi:hypothetical protein